MWYTIMKPGRCGQGQMRNNRYVKWRKNGEYLPLYLSGSDRCHSHVYYHPPADTWEVKKFARWSIGCNSRAVWSYLSPDSRGRFRTFAKLFGNLVPLPLSRQFHTGAPETGDSASDPDSRPPRVYYPDWAQIHVRTGQSWRGVGIPDWKAVPGLAGLDKCWFRLDTGDIRLDWLESDWIRANKQGKRLNSPAENKYFRTKPIFLFFFGLCIEIVLFIEGI